MNAVNISICSPPAVGVNVGGSSGSGVPVYSGEYHVTPKAEEETVLRTANKMLTENVTVGRVPFYEVANISGGKTFIIGEVQNV